VTHTYIQAINQRLTTSRVASAAGRLRPNAVIAEVHLGGLVGGCEGSSPQQSSPI